MVLFQADMACLPVNDPENGETPFSWNCIEEEGEVSVGYGGLVAVILKYSEDKSISIDCTDLPLYETSYTSILEKGWNLFGTMFPDDTPWDDSHVIFNGQSLSSAPRASLALYEMAADGYRIVEYGNVMEPYKTYWLYADFNYAVHTLNPTKPNRYPSVSDCSLSPSAEISANNLESTTLTCTVTDEDDNLSSVTANLTAIGGSAASAMTNAGGDVWRLDDVKVAVGTTPADYDVKITATDDKSATDTDSVSLTVTIAFFPPIAGSPYLDYYPHSINAQWTYRYWEYYHEGEITEPREDMRVPSNQPELWPANYDLLTVTGATDVYGIPTYVFHKNIESSPSLEGDDWYPGKRYEYDNYVTPNLDGIEHERLSRTGNIATDDGLILTPTLTRDHVWTSNGNPYRLEKARIVDDDATVTVGGGTFNHCLKIHYYKDAPNPASWGEEYRWFCKDVGMVKYTVYTAGTVGTIVNSIDELWSYSIP